MTLRIVGLSGSLRRPSRTTALVQAILDALAVRADVSYTLIELSDEAPQLFASLSREQLQGRAAQIVRSVEQADLLVAGTPVYRASYTGAFKHLFDLVHHQYFASKPVLLAATGGTPLHGLVTEHQLRPLFGFLNALTVPTAVYAVESDFEEFTLANPKTLARIDRAAGEALAQFNLASTQISNLETVA
jgi:FMN reductase